MTKRLISILLSIMLIFSAVILMSACGKEWTEKPPTDTEETQVVGEDGSETENLQEDGETLENSLSELRDIGWVEKEGTWCYSETNEECKCNVEITAEENELNLTVKFDYGSESENKENAAVFKADKGIAKQVCAAWFMDIINVAYTEESICQYSLYVGKHKIAEGKMTVGEALTLGEEIDD